MSALLRRWRYGIPHRLISERSREYGGPCKGRKVGHLHTRGACDENNGKPSDLVTFSYPWETIDQLERGMNELKE